MPSKKTSKRIEFEDFKKRADSPFESAQAGRDFLVELERRVWRMKLANLQKQTLLFKLGSKVFINLSGEKERKGFAIWYAPWIDSLAEKYNNREIRRVLAGKRGR